MKANVYKGSIKREILSSKARFASILLIIFLGTAFFAGVRSTSPDMNYSSNEYFKNLNLMDSRIVSTLGLTEKDVDILKDDDRILSYIPSRSFDVSLSNMNNVVKFMEFNKENNEKINTLDVVEGRLPENSGEIALDREVLKKQPDLKTGDNFEIESDKDSMDKFNTKSFTIVGFVNSPMYIEAGSRGTSSVGKGSVDYFAVINSEDINMDVFTEIFVKFKNIEDLDTYSDEYKSLMEENTEYLKKRFKERESLRVEEVKSEAEKKLQASLAEFNNGGANLNLEKAGEALKEKQDEINKLSGTYYYFDREDFSGFTGYRDAINSIKNIASFLPLFFFLVAVLICLTTMTRMVEEKRIEIGTLKALGYSNFEIAKKYIVYASIASIAGSILGIAVGCNLFPRVISTAYSVMYNVGKIKVIFYPSYVIQSLIISIACTVGAALVVLKGELMNKPCDLMRAKAPKIGKKILLERITPLWKRMNFNQKVTLRNIFRYKQRMLMTVFGIAGCMAMLVLGFSLKASNDLIVERQFGELWNYEAMVIHNTDGTEEDRDEYNEVLNSLEGFESSIYVHQESVTLNKEGMNKQTASLYVPTDEEEFKEYVTLRDRKSKEVYDLNDEGVIINEKLASLLKVKAGDSIEFMDADNNTYEVKVSDVVENYTGHTIYMTPKYYEEIFGKDTSYNAEFLKINAEDAEEVSEKLMDCSDVLNVTMIDTIAKSAKDSADSLKVVMVVIIVSAGSLAFIVLYNLNNINVSERIRELSTIKVLGFYDDEVTMYIVRENVILTIMGIVAGSVLGKYVYLYILNTAELDNMMMVHEVHFMRYVTAGILTLLFSVIVMVMMHLKLKKVDMIDALKSVE